jgi:hypothetical protein
MEVNMVSTKEKKTIEWEQSLRELIEAGYQARYLQPSTVIKMYALIGRDNVRYHYLPQKRRLSSRVADEVMAEAEKAMNKASKKAEKKQIDKGRVER